MPVSACSFLLIIKRTPGGAQRAADGPLCSWHHEGHMVRLLPDGRVGLFFVFPPPGRLDFRYLPCGKHGP